MIANLTTIHYNTSDEDIGNYIIILQSSVMSKTHESLSAIKGSQL